MKYQKSTLAQLVFLLFISFSWLSHADDSLLDLDIIISKKELEADFDAMVAGYYELHPAPYHNVSKQEFESAIESIKGKIDKPMTIKQAWQLFSLINPVISDAHAGIVIPRRKTIIQQQLDSGERIFPLHVVINEDNRLFLSQNFNGKTVIASGAEVLSINGRTSIEIVTEMLRHRTGDNPKQQRELLSRWFSEEYWSLFDASPNYQISYLENNVCQTATIQGSDKHLAEFLSKRSFDSFFSYKLLNASTGYIRIETMRKNYKKEFLNLTKEAFTHFKKAKVDNVIIDIRDNGGGGNSMWQKGIMPYIADKPYRYGSTYKAKITEANADPEDVVGTIVSGNINLTQPDLANPLRFKGDGYVLIGAMTYSSAIHFAITVQDNDITKIIGTPSAGRSGTTGMVTDITLKNTGLNAFAPFVLYSRPSSQNNMQAVQPDIAIDYDPFKPKQALMKFAETLENQVAGE